MLCSLNVPAPGAGDGAAQEAQRVTSCSFTGEINIDDAFFLDFRSRQKQKVKYSSNCGSEVMTRSCKTT